MSDSRRKLGVDSIESEAIRLRNMIRGATCRVYNDAAISVADGGSGTALTFNTERTDSEGMHSTSSDSGRITAAVKGMYIIGGSVAFASNATGNRHLAIMLNGTTLIAVQGQTPEASARTNVSVVTMYPLEATHYVELVAYQNSGGALNVDVLSAYSPEFWAVRLP